MEMSPSLAYGVVDWVLSQGSFKSLLNKSFFSLMYRAEDPSIAAMVLDSPFSDLVDLMMELVDTYKLRLPKFTVLLEQLASSHWNNFLFMSYYGLVVEGHGS